MIRQAVAFLTALRFLTRLAPGGDGWSNEYFRLSLAYFPVVGLLLGLILASARGALVYFMPPAAQAGLLLALCVYLTGGLHLSWPCPGAPGYAVK